MFKLGLLILVVVMLLLGLRMSMGKKLPERAPPKLDAAAAFSTIGAGAWVIDVRSAEEYAAGHLPNAQLIPHEQILVGIQALHASLDQPLLLYCRSGHRASMAKAALEQAGYTRVYNGGGYEQLTAFRQQYSSSSNR